jgi:hypothetical protein
MLGKLDLAERGLDRRQFREQGHVIALQLQRALDARSVQIGQRQVQPESQARVAGGAGVLGEVADPFQHRAARHIVQEVLHGAGGAAVDVEHRLV